MRVLKCLVLGMATVLAMLAATPAVALHRSPTPPLQRLGMPGARGAAEKAVRRAVNRSRRLDTEALRSCDRDRHEVDCLFIVRGETANAEFDCRFNVVVRGRHGHPVGRIVTRACQVALRPLLTHAAALAAITSVAERRVHEETLIELERTSRSSFLGYVAWPPSADRPPVCILELSAELVSTGAVLVKSRGLTCEA